MSALRIICQVPGGVYVTRRGPQPCSFFPEQPLKKTLSKQWGTAAPELTVYRVLGTIRQITSTACQTYANPVHHEKPWGRSFDPPTPGVTMTSLMFFRGLFGATYFTALF